MSITEDTRIADAIMDGVAEREGQRDEYRGYGIPASRLGQECDRALWYGLRWASPPTAFPARTHRIFGRGRAAEARMVADLKTVMGVQDVDPDTGQQWRFSMADGWIRGKADGIAIGVPTAETQKHVIEIKCIKAADWRAIKKHGLKAKKPEHWHQLHAGMAGLGIDRGLYVAENADTCEILTERLHLDREEAMRHEARVLRLVGMDEAPPKISDDPASFACRFCDHQAICWGKAWPETTCRSCLHFEYGSGPDGECKRFPGLRTPRQQEQGSECPAHLYLPDLVPGDQIDADPDRETVTYQMPDTRTWTDGAGQAKPQIGQETME